MAVRRRYHPGFTLVELLVTLAVFGLLLALAVPSFTSMIQNNRIRGTTQELQATLQWARSEAIRRNGPIFVTFTSGGNWCYGFDDTANCNCGTANDCQVGGVEKVVSGTSGNVALTANFGGGGNFSFDATGIPSTSGSVTIGPVGAALTVTVNAIGRISSP